MEKMTSAGESTSKKTLKELITAVILLGIIGQLLYLILAGRLLIPQLVHGSFFEKCGLVSRCWWIGICIAVFWAWHLEYSIWKAFDLGEGDAISLLRGHAIIRYLVAVVFMVALYFTVNETDKALATIYVAGVFMLKPGAYLQPLIHRLFGKKEN